ncbi:MAG: prenyltransferase/squalene oxidase repeat-containing protein [Planctomycetota bacterium]
MAQEDVVGEPQIQVGSWSVIGAFQHDDPADLKVEHAPHDFLKEMKPGRNWDPSANGCQLGGKMRLWKPIVGKDKLGDTPFDVGSFNLATATGETSAKKVAFLYCPITASAATEQKVAFGSDDAMLMWLNGEEVHRNPSVTGANPHENRTTLVLEPGVNHLMVQVTQNGGAWYFVMQDARNVAQTSTNIAIDRGVEYLLGRQLIDGSWANVQNSYRNGATSLVLYTLLKSGVPKQHPSIQRGLEFLRSYPSEKTYSASCEVLALAALDDPEMLPWIEERAEDLMSWQDSNGQWAYPDGHWDLSCSQFAILALRAASERGVEVPDKIWKAAIRGAFLSQEPVARKASTKRAGFIYYPSHASGFSGSMTSAGIAVLAICKDQLGDKLKPAEVKKIDDAIVGAMEWLDRDLTMTANPGRQGRQYIHYWLYGLERIGALLETETIGGHDWYGTGSSFLVTAQGAEGQWANAYGEEDICTSFALLFLKKATAAVAITGESSGASKRHHHTPEDKDAIVLHAVEGDPLVFWCVPPENLAVQSVVYFGRRVGEEQWLDLGEGKDRRFGHRTTFDTPGTRELYAEVSLADGTKARTEILKVPFETGLRAEDLAYAGDSTRNKVPAYRPEVRVSTQAGSHSGEHLVDNAYWSQWLCATTDTAPEVEIKLRKKAKATQLLLTQARTRKSEQDKHPRIARVELWINKDKKPTIVEVETSTQRKTVIELPARTKVNFLKIRVIEIVGGKLGAAQVGFSEIELH